MVIHIQDEILFLVGMISLMAITLMGIEIDNHKLFHIVPLFHIVCYECDIGVYAEAATIFARSMVVATSQIH